MIECDSQFMIMSGKCCCFIHRYGSYSNSWNVLVKAVRFWRIAS